MKSSRKSIPWGIATLATLGLFASLIYAGRMGHANARPPQDPAEQLSEQTKSNLATAMHGEAFAYVKYMLYAEQARKNGNPELAALFEKTAQTERFEHFAEEAEISGLVGTDEDNLRDAIAGESYEVATMYPEFAQTALSAGDEAAAERFTEIRKDEMKHRDAYTAALDKLKKQTAQAH